MIARAFPEMSLLIRFCEARQGITRAGVDVLCNAHNCAYEPLDTLLGLTRGGDVVTTGNGNERTVVCGDPVTH